MTVADPDAAPVDESVVPAASVAPIFVLNVNVSAEAEASKVPA